MGKKIIKISFLIMILSIIIWNNKIMPVRKELTDQYLVKVNGMDIINDGIYKAEKTLVELGEKSKSSSSATSSKSSGTSGGSTENVNKSNKNISIKAVSFAEAVKSIQTYTDKTIAGSHIRYFILGEELAKQDIEFGMDFDIRDYEVRTNAEVYIAKGSSAKDFLNKATTGSYEIDEKLKGMEKNNESKGVSYKTTIIDMLKIFQRDDGAGLIPTLKIIDNETEEKQDTTNLTNDSSNTKIDKQTAQVETKDILFDFSGYGIIKNKKLIGYLDREESITSNILLNQFEGTNINIILDNNETVTCLIRTPKVKYKFLFDNNKLKEVIITCNFKSNIEEVNTAKNIFTAQMLLDLEKKQSEQIKSRIENIIKREIEYNTDFLDMSVKLKKSHPYKYMNIKDNFIEELKNAKITVEVNSFVRRTYDYIEIGR